MDLSIYITLVKASHKIKSFSAMCWYKQPSCVAAAAQLSLKGSQSLTYIY